VSILSAAEQRDELAALHPITSSARPSNCANITQKKLKLFRRKVLRNFFFRKEK
jgi:hypothetical protein